MAVQIPDFLQTKKYPARSMRAMLLDGATQQGVVGSGDLAVTQRAAGATMTVDVAAGSGWIKGLTSARQGLYHLYNDAVVNVAVAANASGNPRIDQVILRLYDSVDGSAAQDAGTIEVIQGTPTAGATLVNRTGANSLAGISCIRLADILVANAAASITSANIVDRRPWARGAFASVAGSGASTSRQVANIWGLLAGIPQITLECSGGPVLISAALGTMWNATADATWSIGLMVDGANPLPYHGIQWRHTGVDEDRSGTFDWFYTPTAGRHTFTVGFNSNAQPSQIWITPTNCQLTVAELVRQGSTPQ